jgi:hypothetical protein
MHAAARRGRHASGARNHCAKLARGETLGPVEAARQIEHRRAQRIVAGGRDQPRLGALGAERLDRREEAGAHHHAVGAQHQAGGEPPPVADPAGGDHEPVVAGQIAHPRQQHRQAACQAGAWRA